MNPDAGTAEWQRDAPRADPELEGMLRVCQAGQDGHRRCDQGLVEQLRPERLVPLCDPLVEARLGHEAIITTAGNRATRRTHAARSEGPGVLLLLLCSVPLRRVVSETLCHLQRPWRHEP